LVGGIIQGLISLYNPDYAAPRWHLCLIAIANLVFINVFNVYGSRVLAPAQNPLMTLHICALIVILVILWVLAPHPSAYEVFAHFENFGGWQTTGLSVMIGQITALFGLMCGDAAAHISEEVRDAGFTVPKAMFWGYVVNAIMGIILVVTFLFAIPSVEDALNDPTGFPFLYVFQQALPPGGTAAVTAIVLFLVTASNISFNASTARQTFAFARDKGLPFSSFISKVGLTISVSGISSIANAGEG
jgi:amino acid transporter